MIDRLRDLLTSVFPALERESDFASCKGALVLLTGYTTLRRSAGWAKRGCGDGYANARFRGYADVAARAVTAAQSQHTVLAGQDMTASIVAELASTILAQHERLQRLDHQIQDTFAQHPQAEVIESMPGFGPVLGASLLVAAGDLTAFPTAGHLAAAGG